MDTVAIRQAITAAKQHEHHSGTLARQFVSLSRNIHRSIHLPADNAVAVLLNFTIRYIEHVPEFVEAVEDIADQCGLSNYTDPVINLALEYFSSPPELLDCQQGLLALMSEAYLAHRLMEEVNDRFMLSCGKALIPMDMTRSNLLVHHLIGEPFANQLDFTVKMQVDSLELNEDVFSCASLSAFSDSPHSRQLVDVSRWPCLADSLAINLALSGHQVGQVH